MQRKISLRGRKNAKTRNGNRMYILRNRIRVAHEIRHRTQLACLEKNYSRRISVFYVFPSRPILRSNQMSVIDAVDGSSTRHVSAMDVGADKAPTIRRSYPCKRSRPSVSTSLSRFSRFMASMTEEQCSHPPAAQATLRAGLFPEAAAVPDWYRSLRLVTTLVARTAGAWPHCAPDAAGLCEALCKAA